jgi:predicted lipid-binding transport protein (Tim44 family)
MTDDGVFTSHRDDAMNRRTLPNFTPRTWIGWFVSVVVGLTLIAFAAVFVTAALIAGLVIAAVLLVRVWWLMRKAERARRNTYLSAEYEVESEEVSPTPDRTLGRRKSRAQSNDAPSD